MQLIVFGDWMHHQDHVHIKGHMIGVTSKLYRKLKTRERFGELLMLDIHEFRASVVCNKRQSNEPLSSSNCHVLRCTNSETLLWNRDTNACKNIWKIARAIWKGKGGPRIFRRDGNSATVAEDDSSGTDDDTTPQPQQN